MPTPPQLTDGRFPQFVGVVVPARNESERLASCLHALDRAACATDPRIEVRLVVVLDSCTDDSAAVARGATLRSPMDLISTNAGLVGAARRAGAAHLLQLRPVERFWLATTDADSTVPLNWLNRQLELAAAGAQLAVGTVSVADWSLWPAGLEARYERDYAVPLRADGHGHVHGANLGISSKLYERIGGFPAIGAHEDVAVVDAATALGVPIAWPTDIPVSTSARPGGRSSTGFSGFLRALAADGVGEPVDVAAGSGSEVRQTAILR